MCLCKKPRQDDTWTVMSFLDELTRVGDEEHGDGGTPSYDGDLITQEQDIDGFSEASFDPENSTDDYDSDVSYDGEYLMVSQ